MQRVGERCGRFHLRHFGVTHVGGTCGTLAMLAVFYGKSEMLTQLFRGGA